MKNTKWYFPVILFFTCSLSITAQNLSGSLFKGALQNSKYADIFVYLHTDRNYYLSGESVFFKAYFLDDQNNRTYPPDDTLKAAILDQNGVVIASGIFPVTNSFLRGDIPLPDNLTEGSYILIASSLLTYNLSPEKVFSKIIEIRKSAYPDLITVISLTDTIYSSEDNLTAQIRFVDRDNNPVAASFAYQVSDKTGEVINGNNKASKDGFYSLKIKLPKFDDRDTLKLLVAPSYKGTKSVIGVVIPTRANYTSLKNPVGAILPVNTSRHFNLQMKTYDLSAEKKDKIGVEISVTDDNGTPVMANLSVSAWDFVPSQRSDDYDNIANYISLKKNHTVFIEDQDLSKYFGRILVHQVQSPGSQYLVQKKNDYKKLKRQKASMSQNGQTGYSSDRNIFDIIMQIKPYRREGTKIIFGIAAGNSFNNPEGAIIVIDGVNMGNDASILSNLPVPDIAKIKVSTNIMDIQRYSTMNGNGVIEIFMKKNAEFTKNEETASKTKSNTLFWGPEIMTDNNGKAFVSFFKNDDTDEIFIKAEGITANGLCGSNTINYRTR
jgi:hypothetical protein